MILLFQGLSQRNWSTWLPFVPLFFQCQSLEGKEYFRKTSFNNSASPNLRGTPRQVLSTLSPPPKIWFKNLSKDKLQR